MEIILSRYCQSLSGRLSQEHDYVLYMHGCRCLSRYARGKKAHDGLGGWSFIKDCANLVFSRFPIADDIDVSESELLSALLAASGPAGDARNPYERASQECFRQYDPKHPRVLHAKDIRELAIKYGIWA